MGVIMNDYNVDDFEKESLRMYFDEIKDASVLSIDEEKELFKRIIKGSEEAKEELIFHNLKLVANYAKRYIGLGCSYLDLIQEGNIGLMEAIDKFDYKKGFKFSTYCTYHIKNRITKSLADKSNVVRIPQYAYGISIKITETINKLNELNGRMPTIEEIAKELNTTTDVINDVTNMSNIISLNKPIEDDNKDSDVEFGDYIEYKEDNGVFDDELTRKEFHDLVFSSPFVASDRSRKMLMYRYGFIDGRCYTFKEIGDIFGITKEAVMQNINRSLRNLKNDGNLRDFNPLEKEDYYSPVLSLRH